MASTPLEENLVPDQRTPEPNHALTTDATQITQSQDGEPRDTESVVELAPASSEIDTTQQAPESISSPDDDDELTGKPVGESQEQGSTANGMPPNSLTVSITSGLAAGGRCRSSSWPPLKPANEPLPTDNEALKARILALRLPGDREPDDEASDKEEEEEEKNEDDNNSGDGGNQEEEEEEEPKKYNPFDSESESETDSDTSDDTKAEKGDGGPKEEERSKTSNGQKQEGKEKSPAEAEWARQKKELGDESEALDKLMAMVGLEEVKWEFLKVKATIEAARRRKGVLRRQDLNLVLLGNPGTGKRTIRDLYSEFLKECEVWPDLDDDEDVDMYTYSGHELQKDSDISNLEERLQGSAQAGTFLFIDALEGMDLDCVAHMLSVVDECSKSDKIVTMLTGSVTGATKMLGGSPHGRWLFRRRVQLKDYDDAQLRVILLGLIHRNSLTIEGGEDGPYPKIVARRIGRNRGTPGFGNAHDVIMAFEQMLDRHALRVDKMRTKPMAKEAGVPQDEKEETNNEKAEGGDAERAGEKSEAKSEEKNSKEPADEVGEEAAGKGEGELDKAIEKGAGEVVRAADEDGEFCDEESEEGEEGGKEVSDGEEEAVKDSARDGKTTSGDGNEIAEKPNEVAAENSSKSDEKSDQTLEEGEGKVQEKAKKESSNGDRKPQPEDVLLIAEDIIGPEPADVLSQSEAWKELDRMVGLDDVKRAVASLLNRARTNYHRELRGKEPLQSSLNRVFLGPPGTGKTTVAKLYGKIVAEAGLLSTKEVIFTSPGDFIGQYIGESEVKTSQIMDSSLGKVLIIDEAHMFYHGSRPGTSDESDEFRLACLDTIISRVHNTPGEDRCVILLGYPDMMEEMFQKANPGLRRRFPLEEAFRFHDYDDERLNGILRHKMAKEDIRADKPAMDVAAEVLRRARDRPNFGNGGDVDNLLNQAKARFRERALKQKAAAAAGSPGSSTVQEAPREVVEEAPDLADEDETAVTLERQDFDPEWDRGTRASQKCRALFDGLIGFDGVIDKFQGYQRMAANMRLRGKDPRDTIPFTFVFKGPPGTGKTHTARIIGQVFYDMGFLSTNEVIECSASHMIGQFMGQTAPKVLNLFERALGKVLFIDEAYRLGGRGVRGRGSNYEDEAVGELVDCMTKPRYMRKMIVVLAGYDRDMEALMQVNAGLRGRFATEIVFPPMDASRSRVHLFNLLQKSDIKVFDEFEPSREEKEKVLRLFDKLSMTSGWSNARDVKTLAAQITAQVYRNRPEDGEEGEGVDRDAKFTISTRDLVEFLKDMLRQRIKGGGRT
ncbi:hypothetical protein OQA88_5463 [Cercophora sp. LCS_1]